MTEVYLRAYDLSRGYAKYFSPLIIRKRITAVWHSGIKVFDNEYFYGGGVYKMKEEHMELYLGTKPQRVMFLGITDFTVQSFEQFLLTISPAFTRDKYNLLDWNCNHFSNCVSLILTGRGIPSEILHQSQMLKRTMLGRLIASAVAVVNGTRVSVNDQNSRGGILERCRNRGPPTDTDDGESWRSAGAIVLNASPDWQSRYESTPDPFALAFVRLRPEPSLFSHVNEPTSMSEKPQILEASRSCPTIVAHKRPKENYLHTRPSNKTRRSEARNKRIQSSEVLEIPSGHLRPSKKKKQKKKSNRLPCLLTKLDLSGRKKRKLSKKLDHRRDKSKCCGDISICDFFTVRIHILSNRVATDNLAHGEVIWDSFAVEKSCRSTPKYHPISEGLLFADSNSRTNQAKAAEPCAEIVPITFPEQLSDPPAGTSEQSSIDGVLPDPEEAEKLFPAGDFVVGSESVLPEGLVIGPFASSPRDIPLDGILELSEWLLLSTKTDVNVSSHLDAPGDQFGSGRVTKLRTQKIGHVRRLKDSRGVCENRP